MILPVEGAGPCPQGLMRAGQTEASVDLARMAGLTPSGVLCEIMDDDGEMALNAEAMLARLGAFTAA